MALEKERFSLVRVSRQTPNRIIPQENATDPEVDLRRPSKKETNETPRTKIDLTTALNVPRLSVVKIDEPTGKYNNNSKRQSVIVQPRQSIMFPDQQRNQVHTWIKRSSQNITRPELNWKGTNKWSHGLCACCEDTNMCCYALACWCCFRHEITTMMGEHWCLWFLNCTPLMELRTKFRQQYAIEGSIAKDFCAATFCPICVAMQLANEGRDRGHRIFN